MRPSTPPCPGRRSFCCMACAALALTLLPSGLEAEAPPAAADPLQVTRETRAGLRPGSLKDYRKPAGFFLVADAAGIYAVSAVCTHHGCKVAPEDQGFGCPCHDSEFDLQGNVKQGPAKLPLRHFQVSEQSPGGPLVVDLSHPVDPHVRF